MQIENVNAEISNSDYVIFNLKNMNAINIYKCRIACPEFSNSETIGIKMDNTINCRIKDCYIMNHDIGILLTDNENATTEGIEILDNLIYRNNKQIITENSHTLFYCNISNNIFYFLNAKGVEIKNCQSLKLSKNFFGIADNDCVPFKIFTSFSAGIYDITVNENSFIYYTQAPTNACIEIGDNEDNYSVNGIIITNNSAIGYKTLININNGSGIIDENQFNK